MKVFSVPSLCGALLAYFGTTPSPLVPFPSISVPLSSYIDNQAASIDGATGNFNKMGSTYAAEYLPTGPWTLNGITYDLPAKWGVGDDNVVSDGQVIEFPGATYIHQLHLLYAGDGSDDQYDHTFYLNYDDSVSDFLFTGRNWWRIATLNWAAIRTPYHFDDYGTSKNWNSSHIFQTSVSVSSRVPLRSITLPYTANTRNRIHVFAISITPSVVPSGAPTGPELSIRTVEFGTRWEEVNGQRAQAVAITLANLLPGSLATSPDASVHSKYEVEVTGEGVTTVVPGVVHRLVPADQARFDVLVLNDNGTGNATVRIKDSDGNVVATSSRWPVTPLRQKWTADESVLSTHETPTWWNQAKYGIFFHWGLYSVPAYGPAWNYAEWYYWRLHNPPDSSNPTWNYHLENYGPDTTHDDFMANFTARHWNASAWLDLVDEAGAKYFVFVTKHHDGYALFDTKNTTHRSSVHLDPHRDFLKELMETAKAEKPHLHRGTYFSLPEWFNPYYAPYGFGAFPGGLAHNPFNHSELEPYTGMLNISDYIQDLQYPQMLSLAVDYGTEIMWCDIGGPNNTIEFAAQFYNHAMENGYQVTLSDRCAAVPDFDTPEYVLSGSLSTRKWERTEGVDPFSFGINNTTDENDYKNGTTIIRNLVDIVSKNGNYLLNVGPTAEGDIIAPMAESLLAAGRWLKYAGQCVYATDYWYQASQDPSGSYRFLTTPETFCIVAFDKPDNGSIVVDVGGPVLPIQKGDTIRLLGPTDNGMTAGQALEWTMDQNGVLTIHVPQSLVDLVDYAWAFQVSYV
ncbi:glycoside hydrolase family 29 protein [Boletus edulis]|nr:glycoside hydrolase family 29 protein [Boletus edulis]